MDMTNQAEVIEALTSQIMEDDFGVAPEKSEEPEDHIEEEAEAEQPQEEQTEEAELFTLKWNGEDHRRNKAETIELAQKGFDYTQKTQQVADERKALDRAKQEFQAQVGLNQHIQNELGELTMINRQLNQYKQVNWTQLADEDPTEFSKHQALYSQWKDRAGDLRESIRAKANQLQHMQQQQTAERLRKGDEALRAEIKDWDTVKPDLAKHAKSLGASDDELRKLSEPWVVRALVKAKEYDALKSSKLADKKVKDLPKVAKPGSKPSKDQVRADKYQDVKSKLKNVRSTRHAASLLKDFID